MRDFDTFPKVIWRIGERVALLSDLAASGCVQVLVGIESMVHSYPGFGEKKADLCRVMAALEAIQDHGVGCFVLGANGETRESIANDILASHGQNEFPPQWSPPPWPEYGEGDKNPSLTEIVKALGARSDVPEWVHSAYQEKLNRYQPSYKP